MPSVLNFLPSPLLLLLNQANSWIIAIRLKLTDSLATKQQSARIINTYISSQKIITSSVSASRKADSITAPQAQIYS